MKGFERAGSIVKSILFSAGYALAWVWQNTCRDPFEAGLCEPEDKIRLDSKQFVRLILGG
jgi:hypothetical protein